MNRFSIWMGISITAGALALAACNRPAAQAQQAGPPPPPLVTFAVATAKDVPVYLDAIGAGAASESVTITPQVSGLITERHFEDGADVKKGQLLFAIDPRPFQAQLDLAEAQLAENKAALDLANIQFKRYTGVPDVRAISATDYDEKKNAVDVAKAQIEASQAAIETAKLNLAYCSITSPIDGRAGRRLQDAGNVAVAMQTGLLSLQKLDPMYVNFTIAEKDLPEVQKDMAAGILKTFVRLPSESPEQGREGALQFLDNAVQQNTGTINLRASISNADHHFWPGQFVQVRLVLTTLKAAVLIPTECTQISQQGPYVYVVTPENTSELRQITLGQPQGNLVVVTSGVKAGEHVVLTGQMMLQPGGPVRTDASAPAPQTAESKPTQEQG